MPIPTRLEPGYQTNMIIVAVRLNTEVSDLHRFRSKQMIEPSSDEVAKRMLATCFKRSNRLAMSM